ncbi:MAG: hypothetical protein Q7S53_02755 [bacterium]|nr:hypothetical protein [bacterium]
MIKTENKIGKKQKRIIYIIMVMILLASVAALIYLIFVLINFNGTLLEMNDRTSEVVGGILAIIGAMFGVPVGRKWWQIVYEERGRGAFLKVKR